jgi:hypothetical protein
VAAPSTETLGVKPLFVPATIGVLARIDSVALVTESLLRGHPQVRTSCGRFAVVAFSREA